MKTFECNKCGSFDVYLKPSGSQIGLYCGDCGKWIKWVGKEEKRLVERYIEIRNSSFSKPKYSYETAKQIIFDCIKELNFGSEGLSNQEIAGKLYDVLKQLDRMNII